MEVASFNPTHLVKSWLIMKSLSVSMSSLTPHGLMGNHQRQAAGAQTGGESAESYWRVLWIISWSLTGRLRTCSERDVRKGNRWCLSSVKLLASHTKRLDSFCLLAPVERCQQTYRFWFWIHWNYLTWFVSIPNLAWLLNCHHLTELPGLKWYRLVWIC